MHELFPQLSCTLSKPNVPHFKILHSRTQTPKSLQSNQKDVEDYF